MYKIVEFSHLIIEQFILKHHHPNMILVDATCGRGNDTIFLSRLVKENGHVYSYDIQEIALQDTLRKLQSEHITNVTLKHQSHELISEQDFDVVIFNLGYLPNGDKTITSNHASTKRAVNLVIERLHHFNHDALIVVVVYPGHQEGLIESMVLDDLVKNLSSSDYLVTKFMNYNRPNAPYVLTISKNIK